MWKIYEMETSSLSDNFQTTDMFTQKQKYGVRRWKKYWRKTSTVARAGREEGILNEKGRS